MIYDGEKQVYILGEKEYDEMYDDTCHFAHETFKRDKEIAYMRAQLDIAKQALEEISHWSPWKNDRDERAQKALDDMKHNAAEHYGDYSTNPLDCMQIAIDNLEEYNSKLKSQIKEANAIIKCALPDPIYLNAYGKKLDTFIEKALKYFEKWGVK